MAINSSSSSGGGGGGGGGSSSSSSSNSNNNSSSSSDNSSNSSNSRSNSSSSSMCMIYFQNWQPLFVSFHKSCTLSIYSSSVHLVLPYGCIDHWYLPPFCAYITCPQFRVWTGHCCYCCYCHDLTETKLSRTPLHPLDSKRLWLAGWLWKFGGKMCRIVWQFPVKTEKYVKTKHYFYIDLILQMNIIVAPPTELNGDDTWHLLANGYNRLIIPLCTRKAVHLQRQEYICDNSLWCVQKSVLYAYTINNLQIHACQSVLLWAPLHNVHCVIAK